MADDGSRVAHLVFVTSDEKTHRVSTGPNEEAKDAIRRELTRSRQKPVVKIDDATEELKYHVYFADNEMIEVTVIL